MRHLMREFLPRVDYTDLLCFLQGQLGEFLRNGSGVGICEGSCEILRRLLSRIGGVGLGSLVVDPSMVPSKYQKNEFGMPCNVCFEDRLDGSINDSSCNGLSNPSGVGIYEGSCDDSCHIYYNGSEEEISLAMAFATAR